MRNRSLVTLFFLLSFAVFLSCNFFVEAQNIEVIALEPADAAAVALDHDELEKAQKKFDDMRGHIENHYITETCVRGPGGEELKCRKSGWGAGFQFSKDYKYIVPAPEPKGEGWKFLQDLPYVPNYHPSYYKGPEPPTESTNVFVRNRPSGK